MTRKIAMWLLPYYAGARLPGPLRRWVRRKLQADSVLASHYATLRTLERKAAKHEGLTDAQRNLIRANLFDALDGIASEMDAGDESMRRQQKAPGALGLAFPALGFAVAALFIFVLLPDLAPTSGIDRDSNLGVEDSFQMRGASGNPQRVGKSALGMRVRCLVGNAIVADAVVGARQAEQRLDCQPSGLLAFSGTNLSEEARYVFAVGLGADDKIIWLPPFTQLSEAVQLPAKSVDEVLSHLTPMSALDEDLATLLVVFSEKPFSGTKLSRQLGQLQRNALPLSKMDKLPLDYPIQARVKVRKLP